MQQARLDTYLKTIQTYAVRLCDNAGYLSELLKFIDEQEKTGKEEQLFFKGESAFYQSKYPAALKCYLACTKTNPYGQFFCYRASAHLHLTMGHKEKALAFIEKALQILPLDYPSLVLYLAILEPNTDKFIEIKAQTEIIEKEVLHPVTYDSPNEKQIIREKLEFLIKVRKAHEELLEGLDYVKIDSLQDDKIAFRLYLLDEIERKILQSKIETTREASQKVAIAVYDEVMGFGPIEPLLRDETITDIYINAPDCTYIERKGRIEKTLIQFLDHEHIFRLVQRVASKAGRHLDLSTPYFDAQLSDGSRIHAIIPPCAIDGIKVSLRKYSFQKFDINRLVEGGSMTPTMAKFLQIAVQARFNIAICGGTGSGKTTLLNSLMTSIRQGERIITIEDTPELEPSHLHTVRLLTRAPNPEGKGAVTQADLMINALRMRPDRVVLGELRGAEAFNLLHAMNTGQDGSMVTLHASGSEEVISRLLNMILMARYALSAESVVQQIASALDLIIYVTRLVDGSRRVMTISQVSSDEKGQVIIEDVFKYEIEKISTEELRGHFIQADTPPTNRNLNKLIVSGLLKDYQALFEQLEKVQG